MVCQIDLYLTTSDDSELYFQSVVTHLMNNNNDLTMSFGKQFQDAYFVV